MWSKSKSIILSLVLNILFIGILIAAVIFLPKLVKEYYEFSGRSTEFIPTTLILLYITAIPALGVLISLAKLLINIKRGEVFIKMNITLLRILSWGCYISAVPFLILGWIHLFALLIAVMLLFFGLILRIIKNVFEEAAEIKNENDFTI